MKKILSLICFFFSLSLIGAEMTFTSDLNTDFFTKQEVFVKIFKYPSFSPRQIKKLDKAGYSKKDILILSAVFLFTEDNFKKFYKKIQGKSVEEIMMIYNLDKEIVIDEVRNILSVEIDKADLEDYEDYDKILFYNIAAELGLTGSFYYSVTGSLDIYPADFCNFSAGYELEKYSAENDFMINSRIWDLELNLTPPGVLGCTIQYDIGSGDVDYLYHYFSFSGEAEVKVFTYIAGFENQNETYVTNISDSGVGYKTNTFYDFFAGIEYNIDDLRSLSLRYEQIRLYNHLSAYSVDCNYYSEQDTVIFTVDYSLYEIPSVKIVHDINPEVKYKYSHLLHFSAGADFSLTYDFTEENIVPLSNTGNKKTAAELNSVIYAGVNLYF